MALLRSKTWQKIFIMGTLSLLALVTNGCDASYWDQEAELKVAQAKPQLTVLTVKSPLIYSKTKAGIPFGIDHDLLENFANTYQLQLNFKTYNTPEEAQVAFEQGEGDILAARMRRPTRLEQALPGPAYEDTHLSLFCHRQSQVQNVRDLSGRALVALRQDIDQGLIDRLQLFAPEVQVNLLLDKNLQDAFTEVQMKRADCLISENSQGRYFERFYSKVEFVSALTHDYSLHWWMRTGQPELVNLAYSWFQKASREDAVRVVHERYHTYMSGLDHSDVRLFLKRIHSKLPEFKNYFIEAATEYSLPWQLVAAVAYQESQWEPSATSFTGVKGIMQLTNQTALHLGVEDREDPEQSIFGGAKYLQILFQKTPDNLNSKERLALALAAYNIGIAHLLDAQKLATKKGLNPYAWSDLKKVLPLLADPAVAKDLKYGTARGHETVDFVERVKGFYNILSTKSL